MNLAAVPTAQWTSCGRVPVRAPLPWAALLRYLTGRAIPGRETVEGPVYVRQTDTGRIRVTYADDHLYLEREFTAGNLTLADMQRRVTRLFAADEDPAPADAHLRTCPLLGPHVAALPGLRPLGAWSVFELVLRTVVGQQVSVAAAGTLMRRLADRCGGYVTPDLLADADLTAIGMPGRRTETLRAVARAAAGADWEHLPWPALDAVLAETPGLGPWTRGYLAIRLGRDPDAFPETDLGLIRAAGVASPRALKLRAKAWRPFRAAAAFRLWNTA